MVVTLRPAELSDLAASYPALAAGIAEGFAGDEAGGHTAVAEALTDMTTDAGPAPFNAYWAARAGMIVGLCSFKRGLDGEGAVEIAYFTFADFEGQGIAGAMVTGLLDIATRAGAAALTAHTLPEPNASGAVLTRSGFTWMGEIEDPEDGRVWDWRREIAAAP
ncbi:MAG: hypothetical protein JWP35_401 [Caulobacter sp.]|nr:hypothetical protein [Caulobacter sp.]